MKTSIIKKAIITEKSFKNVTLSKFTFGVDTNATKADVAEACKELFNIDVLAVNIASIKGKVKMTRKGKGRRSDYKKATITVKPGQKIDLFEIEETDKKNKRDTSKEKGDKDQSKIVSNKTETRKGGLFNFNRKTSITRTTEK